jgi:phosphoglycolate phosphatase-like HAD superfamily hydrolase
MRNTYYHAIAFDFDGTIVDTMHSYAEIASDEMSTLYGLSPETAKQLYMETSGIPFFQQLDLIFGPDPRNSECADKFETRKVELFETVRLNNRIREFLFHFRSIGLSIAITSNNFQMLIDRFVQKVPGLFDLALGFGNGYSKGPLQFTQVIDCFGIDRRYLLFVGDSLSDARKALAFGIDFVAISGTLRPDSFTSIFPAIPVISSFAELQELIERQKPLNCKEN